MEAREVIPKRFRLGDVPWTVKILSKDKYDAFFENAPHSSADDDDGSCSIVHSTILLVHKPEYISKRYATHVFYHELVHAILFMMGEEDHDERFVDGFAWYLEQYLNTKSGEQSPVKENV